VVLLRGGSFILDEELGTVKFSESYSEQLSGRGSGARAGGEARAGNWIRPVCF
jgi:hypothetical protein